VSVLIEGITVIFRNATADRLIEGGVEAIRDNAPNRTFRSDGNIAAIGFMTPEDVGHFIEQLNQVGFRHIENGKIADIAVCDQMRGFPVDCDWLGTDVDERGVRFCWLFGHEPGEMVTQMGWNYGQSLYTKGNFRPDDEPVDHLKFLRTEDGLNVYLDEGTGKEVYAGRPFENKDDVHTVRTKALLLGTAVKVVYDAISAEGWTSIQVKTEPDSIPHLIMRYRNQIGLIGVDVNWNGIALTDFSSSVDELVQLGQSMNAIPLVASIDIKGEAIPLMSQIAEVEASRDIEFHLRRPYLLHDISANHEWTEADYDLEAEVELSDWEIHDFGIQVVRQTLEKDGHFIETWDSGQNAVAQIVVIIENRKTFIVVRTVRYPAKEAEFEKDELRLAAELAARRDADLKIASVSLASADDPFDPSGANVHPIYRGAGVIPRFTGLADPKIIVDG
jgi:hypothetical protein